MPGAQADKMNDPVSGLHAAVRSAAAAVLGGEGSVPELRLERSRHGGQGDYSTNAAMLLAPLAGSTPREVAQRVSGELEALLGDELARVEVAGPGFVNLFMSDIWHLRALADVDPPRWVRMLLSTHPPTGERIGMALSYANPGRAEPA